MWPQHRGDTQRAASSHEQRFLAPAEGSAGRQGSAGGWESDVQQVECGSQGHWWHVRMFMKWFNEDGQ